MCLLHNYLRKPYKKRRRKPNMKNMKRILSGLLVLAMVLSLCPVIVFAEEPADVTINIATMSNGTVTADKDSYKVGDTVWYLGNNDTYQYFRCIENIDDADQFPPSDTTHWESVTVYNQLDTSSYNGNLQYKTISDEPILLYVSKTAGVVNLGPEMEIDYKVRLYLEGVKNAAEVKEYVVFDTLGPEFMASTQMVLLSEFADAMKHIRDVAVERAGRS